MRAPGRCIARMAMLAFLSCAQAPFAATAADAVVQLPGEPKLIFVKSGASMIPLAILEQGRFKTFPSSSQQPSLSQEMQKRYFRPGRTFYLSANAAPGLVEVLGPSTEICAQETGNVRNVSGAQRDGIVTNFLLAESAGRTRPFAPDAQAYRTMNLLVSNTLRHYNVHPKHRNKMVLNAGEETQGIGTFTAVPVRGSTYPMLVAFLTAYDSDVNFSVALTLFAEADHAGHYRVSYEKVLQTGDNDGVSAGDFFTSADLDGDGVDEIIARYFGFECSGYEALARFGDTWRPVVSGPAIGC